MKKIDPSMIRPTPINSITTPLHDGKEPRLNKRGNPSSSSILSPSAVATLTFAASYLFSTASCFTPPSKSRSILVEQSSVVTASTQKASLAYSKRGLPFGVVQDGGRASTFMSLGTPSTRLYMTASSGGDKDDKDEWRAILAAFQLYKAAYGDLKVPLRFVVPSAAPWPGE